MLLIFLVQVKSQIYKTAKYVDGKSHYGRAAFPDFTALENWGVFVFDNEFIICIS